MDILGKRVRSAAFGAGVITEQTESIVTVDFNGTIKKFEYPAAFEKFLTADDAAAQEGIDAELSAVRAEEAHVQRIKRRNTLIEAEQQKAEARKVAAKSAKGRTARAPKKGK